MALSGTIIGSTNNRYIDAKIVWSATQSIDGNYSMVTATLYYSRNNTGYTTYGTWSGSITINGTNKTSSSSLSITYNSNTKAITSTVKVPHNNDGTKSITISATGSMSGTTLSSTSVTDTIILTTIPRAATLNSLSCSSPDLNGVITYKYTPTTTSYYIQGNLSLNVSGNLIAINSDNNDKPDSVSQKFKTITLNADQLEAIYKELPNSTKATLRLTLRTYSDSAYSKQIGNADYKEIPLTIPSSVKPTVGDITLNPTNITINGTSYDYLIKGKNTLSISVSDSSAGVGSNIKSYAFSGPSVSTTKTSASTSVSTVTNVTSFINEKATLTYQITVTDYRNRSSTPKTKTITCYDYQNPFFSAFKVSRSGTTLRCTYTPVFSSINGKNIANVKIYYATGSIINTETVSGVASGTSTSTSITLSNTTSTYQVYAVITDGLNETGQTVTKTMYGESRVINVREDGTGIAFGKMAEQSNLFECRWPSRFNGLMISTGGIRTEGYGAGNKYFETRRTNPPDAADDAHKNVKMQMYVGDAGYPTIRNQYSIDNGETWTTRSYLRLQDDGLYTSMGRFTSTSDANPTEQNDVPLRIGTADGEHIDIDSNEIMAKDSPTKLGTLALSGSNVDLYSGTTLTLRVGSDATSEYVESDVTYNRTYSAASNMYITSNGVFGRATSSSERYKKDIENVINDELNPYKILDIPVVQYRYKEDYIPIDKEPDDLYIGFKAEDVANIYPVAAEYNENGQVEMWNIKVIVPAMLKIVQDQQKEIEALRAEINNMKNT